MIALEPVQVEELLASAQGEEGPSDGGGAATDLSVSVPDLLAVMVPTLEPRIADCPTGWVSVEDALVQTGSNVTEVGSMLEVGVVCAGGDQLIVSTHDM